MVIFGYVIYMAITLFVTALNIGCWFWPSQRKGENLFFLVLFIAFWTGAYKWFPFTVTVS